MRSACGNHISQSYLVEKLGDVVSGPHVRDHLLLLLKGNSPVGFVIYTTDYHEGQDCDYIHIFCATRG